MTKQDLGSELLEDEVIAPSLVPFKSLLLRACEALESSYNLTELVASKAITQDNDAWCYAIARDLRNEASAIQGVVETLRYTHDIIGRPAITTVDLSDIRCAEDV